MHASSGFALSAQPQPFIPIQKIDSAKVLTNSIFPSESTVYK
ncbi:hypothetical protein predicted by Glimmer/Critica [Bdellovibrio bacteriovorus HD100]|uniref:Uncharacterized protein n=1 Tax=Bdellovibrio bacteriovorus (strain ATCC 15356 / DSM 50701 / NCIMB 9529 / HD100) TaxID=264462 RepID=Q6MIU8_BDEBA|nr:hypothetical protein predicted by Glimmer/Critica [Bdellovibrio bacteriovorus HD100]